MKNGGFSLKTTQFLELNRLKNEKEYLMTLQEDEKKRLLRRGKWNLFIGLLALLITLLWLFLFPYPAVDKSLPWFIILIRNFGRPFLVSMGLFSIALWFLKQSKKDETEAIIAHNVIVALKKELDYLEIAMSMEDSATLSKLLVDFASENEKANSGNGKSHQKDESQNDGFSLGEFLRKFLNLK